MLRRGPNTRRLVTLLMAATLVLVVAVVVMGVLASQRLVALVTDQFNTQQLMLARQVAQNIETRFLFLEKDLQTTAEVARDRPITPAALDTVLGRLRRFGVLEMRLYGPAGRLGPTGGLTHVTPEGPRDLGPQLARVLQAAEAAATGDVATGESYRSASGEWLQLMAIRLGDHGGELVAVVDPLAVAQAGAGSVRSGQSGYAFVINRQGYFLYHYVPQFIGQDAFRARAGRNPLISFERINRIQKDYMLRGLEGTSWYTSGWHRQKMGPVQKLIAYTPVPLDGDNFWSVAVVAPTSEVDGLVMDLQVEQWALTGLALLVVVAGFGAAVFFTTRWSSLLAAEVDNKTAALRQSEADLRAERDKVKASLDQLIEAQDRLIRSERLAAIGEAAAKVCHEIKNPLMVIGGFGRQLLRQAPEEGKVREKLGIIVDEVGRLESMMIEVGDFTKPTRLNRRPTDLNALAAGVHQLMAEEMGGRGIDFRVETTPGLPPADCDPDRVKQVLINLIKNAAEAMPEGGRLRLVLRPEPGLAAIDVIDTGKGIAPEHLESIFTPFFTTKKGGSGLGLSVCYKLIQDHGGRIDVRSEPGVGSTFSVQLPLAS